MRFVFQRLVLPRLALQRLALQRLVLPRRSLGSAAPAPVLHGVLRAIACVPALGSPVRCAPEQCPHTGSLRPVEVPRSTAQRPYGVLLRLRRTRFASHLATALVPARVGRSAQHLGAGGLHERGDTPRSPTPRRRSRTPRRSSLVATLACALPQVPFKILTERDPKRERTTAR